MAFGVDGTTVIEWIDENGDIFLNNILGLKSAINERIKYTYGNRLLVYTDRAELNEICDMLMAEKEQVYQKMYDLAFYQLPADYTYMKSTTDTKTNTGTQTTVDDKTKTNSGTQAMAKTGTVGDVGSDTNSGTVVEDVATKETTTSKTGGLDSGTLTDYEKVTEAPDQTTTTDTTKVDKVNTRTNNLTDTRTDNLLEDEFNTNTRTDALTETNTHEEKVFDVDHRIDELERLELDAEKMIFSVIAEDFINLITLQTWEEWD